MGGKFSVFILKSKLEVAVKRMQGQMNKKTNYIKVQRREIAQLLADRKDESARIRVEALLHEIHMVEAMEIVSLMCQLLAARTSLIASEKYMPDDLIEAAASIIFCAKRMEIPELVEIAKQFAFKFTEEWVKTHINNQSEKVNAKVLSKLTIRAPEFKVVINYLTDIAKQYNVAWEPSYAEEADKDANPNALGAIAPISYNEAKLQAQEDDDRPFKAGVLNITVHEARKLYQTKLFGTMDPYVTLTLSGNNAVVHKTRVMKNSGVSIAFHEEYFPFAVKDSGMTIRAEAFTKRDVVADDFIGRAFLSVDQLILNPQKSWYRLGRQYNEQTDAGELLISTQFMPFNSADDQELHQGDAPRFVSPPLGPAGGVAAQISGQYSPSPVVSPVLPSTNLNGFIANGMAPATPASPLPPAAHSLNAPAYAQPPSYSPHHDSPTPNGFNTYAPQPPSYDAHPDPLAPYQAHNSPPPVSIQPYDQPYDLPSVPQSNAPAARDGPPDFEELEARFRALQKS